MVNEKEDHYEEEGEYHFSDDQANYDAAPETVKTASAPVFTKESIVAKLNQYRKGILGGVSVIVLITIVYKVLIPSSSVPPSTDFSKAPLPVKTAKPITKPPVAAIIAKPSVPSAAPAPAAQQQAPAAQQTQAPAAPITAQPQQNQLPVVVDAQTKNIIDRLTVLEQQNTAMMNLLQTEYAQKIADAETVENATQGKMEEVTKRVNRMETSLAQMTELLKGMSKSQSTEGTSDNASGSVSEVRSTEPKTIYTVQAIIPGRAWLKSESGDTVTVAEGDYLKSYGRVTKIDPYDGVVAIDTGKRVIMLSYGMGSD